MAIEPRATLELDRVGKKYRGDFWGLSDFSLTLEPGVLGLLGPNGAGKSTLMRIIATVTRPTTGTLRWKGADIVRHPDAMRAVLGYLPQNFGVYPNLTPVEFLEYLAAVKGVDARSARTRIDALLTALNLDDARRRPLGGFSGGMRQRVGIAQALLNDPEVLIVDEPTAGLDPEERVRFRHLLSELPGERVVILSSHIVSDVEAVAAKIAILSHGRLVAHAAPEDLLATVAGRVWEITIAEERLAAVKERAIVAGMVRRAGGLQLRVVADESPAPDARALPPTLEDAYLRAIAGAKVQA